MVVLTIFGWSALLLAAIGVYGLAAYSVEQRSHEFGIRIALGAQRSELMGLVLKDSMAPILIGIVIGLCGAAVTTRYLEGMLFGVSALDWTTFMAVSLMFASVAAVASTCRHGVPRELTRSSPSAGSRATQVVPHGGPSCGASAWRRSAGGNVEGTRPGRLIAPAGPSGDPHAWPVSRASNTPTKGEGWTVIDLRHRRGQSHLETTGRLRRLL